MAQNRQKWRKTNEQLFVPFLVIAAFIKTHHEKTDLKVFVDVIPKEGLVGWGPANPSLGITTTTEYIQDMLYQ